MFTNRTKVLMVFLIVSFFLVSSLAVNCLDDDDDDDDLLQDNDDDDDDSGEDDSDPPVISSGHFEPDQFTWTEACEDQNAAVHCTYLVFEVCDPGNNLPGGEVFAYHAGTDDLALFSGPFPWDTLFNAGYPSDAEDCNDPLVVELGIYFIRTNFPQIGTYKLDLDIEVTDGSGNLSNKLKDITVIIQYNG